MTDQEPPFFLGGSPISEIAVDRSPKVEKPLGIGERVTQTLERHDYQLVTHIGEYPYPSPEQWIDYYKATGHKHPPRNYQAFLLNNNGRYVFGKTKITEEHVGLGTPYGGLRMEADVLGKLPKEIPAPQLIQYVPADTSTGELELLVTEAIPFSEGTMLPLELWNAQIASQAATRIKQIENIPMARMQNMAQEPIVPVTELITRTEGALSESFRDETTRSMDAHKPYTTPVLVHGDTWIKNVVVKNPYRAVPDIMLVDWERAGAGYRGQDAGRTLWQLWDNEKTRSFAGSYCNEATDSEKQERKILLTFGVNFEALRWIADRNDVIKTTQDQKQISQIKGDIAGIQQKAQAITQFIDTL